MFWQNRQCKVIYKWAGNILSYKLYAVIGQLGNRSSLPQRPKRAFKIRILQGLDSKNYVVGVKGFAVVPLDIVF